MSSMSAIQDFLAQERIAVVGVSHDPNNFSRMLFKEFRERGYDVVPVNPQLQEVDGARCFAHVRDIQPPVSAVLLMTAPTVTDQVVEECAESGISRVWMYSAGRDGANSEHAIHFCESRGMTVIPGECPLMFLPSAGWFHRAHGFFRRVGGSYPR